MEQPDVQPRLLTSAELDYVLSGLPRVMSAAQDVGESIHQALVDKLRAMASEVKLTPLALEEFRTAIARMYEKSRVQPGEPVGTRTAESIGGPTTQLALNTFHSSGSARNVSSGIEAMRELLNAHKKRKLPSMSIHFLNKRLTYEEVYRKRSEFVNISVGDIVSDYTLDTVQMLPPEWWHQAYLTLNKKQVPSTPWVLRLYLNVNAMYAYRITMEDVAKALELDIPPAAVAVCSPLHLGIIDIYPVEELITEALQKDVKQPIPPEQAGMTFLNLIVLPHLDDITVKGIKGIKGFFPVEIPVWSIVRDELPVYTPEQIADQPDPVIQGNMRRAWYLVYNRYRRAATGLSAESLRYLCETVGMTVAQEHPDYLVVIMPEVAPDLIAAEAALPPKERFDLQRPGKYVQRRLKIDEAASDADYARRKAAGEVHPVRVRTPLQDAASYVYADTNGTNLLEALQRDDVDTTRTVSNDFHEMAAVFGIKAARNSMVREFIDVIAQEGSYINPRHIFLLVDYMTSRGEILAITFAGVSRQPVGAIAKAAFERTLETVSEAAGFGRKEQVISTTASIFTGKRMKMGTGAMDILHDEARFQELLRELQTQQAQVQVNTEELTAALENLDLSGADLNAEMEGMFTGGKVPPLPSSLPTVPVAIDPQPAGIAPLQPLPALTLPTQLTKVRDQLAEAPTLPTGPSEQPVVIPVPSPVATLQPTIPEAPAPTVLPSIRPTGLGLPALIAEIVTPPTTAPVTLPVVASRPNIAPPSSLLPTLDPARLRETDVARSQELFTNYQRFLDQ